MSVINNVSGAFEIGKPNQVVWSILVKGSDSQISGRGNTEAEARANLCENLLQMGLSEKEIEVYLLDAKGMFGSGK